jgi:hypothetical protein
MVEFTVAAQLKDRLSALHGWQNCRPLRPDLLNVRAVLAEQLRLRHVCTNNCTRTLDGDRWPVNCADDLQIPKQEAVIPENVSPFSKRRRPSYRSWLVRLSTSGRLLRPDLPGLGVAGMCPVLDWIGAFTRFGEILGGKPLASFGIEFWHFGSPCNSR